MHEPRAAAPGRRVPAGAGVGPGPPPSDRVRLARVALDSALAVEGVVAGHPGAGGVGVVEDAGVPLRGVTAAALPEGRFEVGLHLVAAPVPLQALAESVRDGILRAASRAGLEERVGPINVAFEDLLDPAEPTAPPPP